MIEKLFTSKNRIKIMSYLFFENGESYLREISTKLKIVPSAVKTELDNLEKIGVIKKEGKKIKLNKNCNFIEDLKNILIKTDYLIYPIKEEFKDNNIKFLILFGSFAKGDYSHESDIDLLFIGSIKQSEVFKKIKNTEKKIKRDINPIVWSIGDLEDKKDSAFIKDIATKKFIILKGDENEFKRIIRK